MSRLPIVFGDLDDWGDILNQHLTFAAAGGTGLAADVAAAATTVDLGVATGLNVGQLLAVGIGTSTCEVRRVTSVSGNSVTLNTAFKYAHTANELARRADFWVPALWWGAVPSSSVDSFRNLSNMFLDQQTIGIGIYGIIGLGHTLPFYTSRPLWLPDFHWSSQLGISAFSPFAWDPGDGTGIWNYANDLKPLQHLLNASGQFGTISSVNTGTDTLTLSTSAGSVEGDEIAFYTREGLGTLPSPLVEGRTYFIKTAPGGNQYTLAIDKWGASTLDITSDKTGEVCWWSTGNCRVNTDRLYLSGRGSAIGIRGLSGFRGTLQQQTRMNDTRIENFSGWAATVDGQQSEWINSEFINNGRGNLRIAGGKFVYVYGGNFEGGDVGVQQFEMGMTNPPGTSVSTSTAAIRNNIIFGAHFESAGGKNGTLNSGSWLKQTISVTGTPSAGTFTLNGQTLNWNASNTDVQTACDTLFGAGNTVVTGGALPGATIQIAFQGVYANGWGPTLTIVNSITGGSYSINTISPDAAQIDWQGGFGFVAMGCVDSIGTLAVASGGTASSPPFFRASNGGTAAITNGSYLLTGIDSLASFGNIVDDSLRRSLTRKDNDTAGCSQQLVRWVGAGRHGSGIGRHDWQVGDGGRYTAFGAAGAATWEVGGATSQANQLLRLVPASSQTGNALEATDTSGTLKFLIAPDGTLRLGGASGPRILSGAGTPEGSITAPQGSLYLNTSGGAGVSLYVKETGTGNTGWVGK